MKNCINNSTIYPRNFFLLLLILVSLNMNSEAQNLVPNWSFEDTIACPSMLAQINYATGWESYRESPDYFNSCASSGGFSNPSVPENSWGYQYPKSGSAYGGITTFSIFNANWREFLGTQLSQTLMIGQKYFASFYVSRSANNVTHMNFASNKLGLRLSTIPYSISNPLPVDNYSQIYSDTLISDTLNWVRISGSFIADSAYEYISFGNFFTDSATSIIQYDSTASYAFYYLDDIRVSTDSNFVNSVSEEYSHYSINVFPNPAHEWIIIKGHNIKSIFIFDLLGNKCMESISSNSNVNKVNVSDLSRGIYFIQINLSQINIIKKIILN
jgi:hypothetical protein